MDGLGLSFAVGFSKSQPGRSKVAPGNLKEARSSFSTTLGRETVRHGAVPGLKTWESGSSEVLRLACGTGYLTSGLQISEASNKLKGGQESAGAGVGG